jgi:hypothetical protein
MAIPPDIEQFRLSANEVALDRPPRRRLRHKDESGRFIKGPLPFKWMCVAASLPGRALAVGLALWFEAGCKKSDSVTLTSKLLGCFGLERGAKMRALQNLQRAGLIEYSVTPGKNPEVRILHQ